MRTRKYRNIEKGSTYDLSISDLMSALCCIFVLVTISIVASLKEKNNLAEKYQELQEELYVDLSNEFSQEELNKWGAYIDPETLSIRFSGVNVSFKDYDDKIPQKYKEILDDFFPRLIQILKNDKYRNEIEEIRIEGHSNPADGIDLATGRKYKAGDDLDYSTGIDLSQRRTANVLNYCLDNFTSSMEEKEWVRKHIAANGYSLSKPIYIKDSDGEVVYDLTTGKPIVDKAASRRVEFRIKTNSDKIVQQFKKINGN
ncbi:MAG: OmpA family protein [Erysipelotrichaceae bacterium]|nr:OmpA family protein [Erysipelotrichaceae bacterium]